MQKWRFRHSPGVRFVGLWLATTGGLHAVAEGPFLRPRSGLLTSLSARHPKPLLREGRSLVFVSKASRGHRSDRSPRAAFPLGSIASLAGRPKPRFSSRSLIAVAINTCTVVSSAAATPLRIRLTLGSRWAPTSTVPIRDGCREGSGRFSAAAASFACSSA